MRTDRRLSGLLALIIIIPYACSAAQAQRRQQRDASADEFGPNVRAYLGYLHNEQEVVDDRASRREINPRYYVHNSNRISALRQMAVHIARASDNDYLPEMEAVSMTEFELIFDEPLPKPTELHPGEVFQYKLKYLGTETSRGEKFYLFARLDPYEQVEQRKKAEAKPRTDGHAATARPTTPGEGVRPRRVSSP